jgi:hypothetical protein
MTRKSSILTLAALVALGITTLSSTAAFARGGGDGRPCRGFRQPCGMSQRVHTIAASFAKSKLPSDWRVRRSGRGRR